MSWSLPRLTRRAILKATGSGGIGLSLLRQSGLIGSAMVAETGGAEALGYTIGEFCSSVRNIRTTSRTQRLAGNPNSTLNCGKLHARCGADVRQTCQSVPIETPLMRIVSQIPLDMHPLP